MKRTQWLGVVTILLLQAASSARAQRLPPPEPLGADELQQLTTDLRAACKLVREHPQIWPVRAFPYGPLGLEARKASTAEANEIRNFHLGLAAAMCKVPQEQVTAAFFCGPECPKNRRAHLVDQLPKVRAAAAAFEKLGGVRMLAIWAPKGEFRVNDVFVMDGMVREAIPSEKFGLVPSGRWKPWTDVDAYLATIKVTNAAVTHVIDEMQAIGLSAIIREKSHTRLVGVGIADNESGLLLLPAGIAAPKVGDTRPDGGTYQVVESVAPGVWFYETS